MRYPNKSRPGVSNPNWLDGRSKHPLYFIWKAMLSRCENPDDPNWERYGARGITVCERWHDFWNFTADVGERPAGKNPAGRARYEIDRIDNDGNYEPSNVRWARRSEQMRNRTLIRPTHCPAGHDYAETAMVNSSGNRECLVCKRERAAAHARRARANKKETA